MVLLHQLNQLQSDREEQHGQKSMTDIFSLHRRRGDRRDLQVCSEHPASRIPYPSRNTAAPAHSASPRLHRPNNAHLHSPLERQPSGEGSWEHLPRARAGEEGGRGDIRG